MAVLAIFRFCGIGYFANEYKEHTLVPWVQDIILFSLKWVELIFILGTVTKIKMRYAVIISFVYTNIYWFISSDTVSFIVDVIYYMFVPFIVSKFDYKRITYGLILALIVIAYQFLMMLARYNIDLSAKFNYIAMIESIFDYKIFILSCYLFIKCRRCKNGKQNKYA